MPKTLRRTKVVERIDPDEDFSDVDGDLRNEFALTNEDPSRHYVWAHDSEVSIGEFKGDQLGYVLERYDEKAKGVSPLMGTGFQHGEVFKKKDHVLMSCDKALWEKRQRYERKVQRERAEKLHAARQKTVEVGKHRHEWAAVGGG